MSQLNKEMARALLIGTFPLWNWELLSRDQFRTCLLYGSYKGCSLEYEFYESPYLDDLAIDTPNFNDLDTEVVRADIVLVMRLAVIKAARAETKDLAKLLIKSVRSL